jgi:hypothetical protein
MQGSYCPRRLLAVSSIVAQGQTFTTLVSFNRTNGASPQFVSLVQGGMVTCGERQCAEALVAVAPRTAARYSDSPLQFRRRAWYSPGRSSHSGKRRQFLRHDHLGRIG